MKIKELKNRLNIFADDLDVCILPYSYDSPFRDAKMVAHTALVQQDMNDLVLLLIPQDDE